VGVGVGVAGCPVGETAAGDASSVFRPGVAEDGKFAATVGVTDAASAAGSVGGAELVQLARTASNATDIRRKKSDVLFMSSLPLQEHRRQGRQGERD
jgi:hypothetical protein